MGGHGIIAWIIIGIIAGWLTGKIMKGSGFGFFMDMIVGLVGALIGGFISRAVGLGGLGEHGLIMSIIIAVILIAALLARRSRIGAWAAIPAALAGCQLATYFLNQIVLNYHLV